MREFWVEIEEAPNYVVSQLGRVKNVVTGYVLNPWIGGPGYLYVTLCTPTGLKKRRVHQLVARAFYEPVCPSLKLEVNHDDGDKSNNYLGNLEWVTSSKNKIHAFDKGLHPGARGGLIRIIETGEIFETQRQVAAAIGGYASNVWKCLHGQMKHHRGYTFEWVD